MKTLLVLRHAKSSWNEQVEDHERPLNKRGKADAPRMGQIVLDHGLLPELILSSSAKRARSTAKKFAKAAGYQGKTVKSRELYFNGVNAHLNVLSELDDRFQRVMIVGHNPDLEALIHELTGQIVEMPTCALACIDFGMGSWKDVKAAKGKLRQVLKPKDL